MVKRMKTPIDVVQEIFASTTLSNYNKAAEYMAARNALLKVMEKLKEQEQLSNVSPSEYFKKEKAKIDTNC